MQILVGPRQVGRTTIAQEAAATCGLAHVYASADGPSPHSADWIDRHWGSGVREARSVGAFLVLDKVQKVPHSKLSMMLP
jgi:predicted AAA+ superfamily ATPase